MDLLHNPFYILKATQQDNRHRIIELAEEKILLADADACITARTELTNPRKRVAAEMAWMPSASPERVYDMLLLLEVSGEKHLASGQSISIPSVGQLSNTLHGLPNARTYNVADKILDLLKASNSDTTEIGEFLGIDTLTPIARANLLAARMLRLPDYTPNVAAEWILEIVKTFESISPSDIHATLNVERAVSGFPEITELSDITSEIQKRRRYYQQVIKCVLVSIPTAKERLSAAMNVINAAIGTDTSHWPVLVEDTVEAYEEVAAAFLETAERDIETQNQEIRIAADEDASDIVLTSRVKGLLHTVKDWEAIAHPIQRHRNRQGLGHDASHDVADRVRQLAIFLFNEYDKLDSAQKILSGLQEVFTELPTIVESIAADLETLNRIAERRAQQRFSSHQEA